MYSSHRGMMPQHVPPQNRVADLLDSLRVEFDNVNARAIGESNERNEGLSMKVGQQIQEVMQMKERIAQIETAYTQIKTDYEKRIRELERELETRGGHSHAPPQHHMQQQPPQIGHGPRDLFGQIMAGGGGQNQSSLAPPPQEPPQPQGLPAHLTQNSGLSTGPQPPQHQPYAGYQGPGVNGYGPQPPPLAPSPGPGKGRGRGLPGASTPQQGQPMPFPGSPRNHGPTPPPPGSQRRPAPPPPAPHYQIQNVGNELTKLNVDELPPGLKTVGDDWFAIFNPQVARSLDIKLVHNLTHQSVVCCVRFSYDGRYIATGSNRVAQIFEVESGQLAAHLGDDPSISDKDGDLYIRSVCFSPDGKYLATGAEDKVIRVWDIERREIVQTFTGHEQDIYSLDFSRNGRIIASGSGDRTVRLWDLEKGQLAYQLQIEEGVTTVALSPDGRLVAAGSLDRTVRVWDAETARPMDTLEGPGHHADSVYSVAFSPSGRELVSGSLDKTIKLWELSNLQPQPMSVGGRPAPPSQGRCIHTFEGHSDFVLSVALSPDGKWVMSGSKDRGVVFWDPSSGVAQLHLQGHRNSVISVAPSPKVGLFATGSGDFKARIWSYEPYRG